MLYFYLEKEIYKNINIWYVVKARVKSQTTYIMDQKEYYQINVSNGVFGKDSEHRARIYTYHRQF